MKIDNPELSMATSACLKTFSDLANANTNISLTVETLPAKVKGELITEIVFALTSGLATNLIYDLLKLAIQQHSSQLTDDDYIVVNKKKIPLKEILSSPALKEHFQDDAPTKVQHIQDYDSAN